MLDPDHPTLVEQQELILNMRRLSDLFYTCAVQLEENRFIEINGIMQEYIKIAEETLNRDGTLWMTDHQPHKHQLKYIAEKLDCLFGDAMKDYYINET